MSYDAIVFDSDGVFVQPTDRGRVREGVAAALESLGVSDPATEHVDAFAGATEPARLEAVCRALDADLETAWSRREACVSARQRELLETGEKGAYEDIDALAALAPDYDLGVVSNNQHATVAAVLESTGLDAHVSIAYGREPTIEGLRRIKPAPYYVERVLTELDSSNALYVGDSVTDIEVAERVGIDVAYVERSHNERAGSRPTYRIESLRELPAIADRA